MRPATTRRSHLRSPLTQGEGDVNDTEQRHPDEARKIGRRGEDLRKGDVSKRQGREENPDEGFSSDET